MNFQRKKTVILGNGVQIITELSTVSYKYKYFRMTRRVMVPNFYINVSCFTESEEDTFKACTICMCLNVNHP